MTYNPVTDFVSLSRLLGSENEFARVPGLDFVLSALQRAGMFNWYVGQTAPTANQPTTVWLKPALPSWTAEGAVFLWDVSLGTYAPASPQLWTELFAAWSTGYVFQSLTSPNNVVQALTSLAVIQRTTPSVTGVILPTIASRRGTKLQIADWSDGVTAHVINLTPAAGQTIMRRSAWTLYSTADQLAGVTLQPSPELNGWVIAP